MKNKWWRGDRAITWLASDGYKGVRSLRGGRQTDQRKDIWEKPSGPKAIVEWSCLMGFSALQVATLKVRGLGAMRGPSHASGCRERQWPGLSYMSRARVSMLRWEGIACRANVNRRRLCTVHRKHARTPCAGCDETLACVAR